MQILSSVQEQTLRELFNTHIRRAAAGLGAMLNDDVQVSVPKVHCVTVNDVTDQRDKSSATMYCLRQPLNGIFSGNAVLAFAEEKYLALIKVWVANMLSGAEPDEMQSDAPWSAGSTLLASCVSSLDYVFDTSFECGAVTQDRGDIRKILGTRVQNHVVLLIQVRFAMQQQDIEGFVAFVFNITSFDELLRGVDRFLARNGRASVDARRT